MFTGGHWGSFRSSSRDDVLTLDSMESARMTPELQGLKEAIILRGPGYVVMIMGKKSALTFQDLF